MKVADLIRAAAAAAWDECEAAQYEIVLDPETNTWNAVKRNPYKDQP